MTAENMSYDSLVREFYRHWRRATRTLLQLNPSRKDELIVFDLHAAIEGKEEVFTSLSEAKRSCVSNVDVANALAAMALIYDSVGAVLLSKASTIRSGFLRDAAVTTYCRGKASLNFLTMIDYLIAIGAPLHHVLAEMGAIGKSFVEMVGMLKGVDLWQERGREGEQGSM